MNIPTAQRRILVCVVLPACVVYFGLRVYAQFRHVDVYVMRTAPMPAGLGSGLHMEEHKIDPMVGCAWGFPGCRILGERPVPAAVGGLRRWDA